MPTILEYCQTHKIRVVRIRTVNKVPTSFVGRYTTPIFAGMLYNPDNGTQTHSKIKKVGVRIYEETFTVCPSGDIYGDGGSLVETKMK